MKWGGNMNLLLIAKSNMRKRKSNVVILFVLVMLATMLLYTSINVLKNIDGFLDEKNEARNGAHVCLLTTDNYMDEIEEIIKKEKGFSNMESELFLASPVANKFKNLTKKQDEENMSIAFQDISVSKTISNWDIVDKADTLEKNSIVMPMYLKVANDYETGDEVSIEIGKEMHTFVIYGFTEDPMFATPSNITIYRCMITHDMFEEIKEKTTTIIPYRIYNIRLKDVSSSETYKNNIFKQITSKIDDPAFNIWFTTNFTSMKLGTSMFINILMVVLAGFSVLVILISIVVIRFSITANLEDNLSNIGILEALGYTSKQLIKSIILEYGLITMAGIAVGFLLAKVASNKIGAVVSSSIGLIWTPQADFLVAGITVIAIVILIFLAINATAKKYKKITPLEALRVGIETHNFKKNHFPLKKSIVKLHTTLGIKDMFYNKKQNISISLIVILLSYTCVMMLSIYYNFVGDTTSLINLVGVEKPNIQISYQSEDQLLDEASIKKEADKLRERKEIEETNLYGEVGVTVYNQDIEENITAYAYEDLNKLTADTLIEGRRPKHDNEINVTNVVADMFDVKLGGSIDLRIDDTKASFVIVGITQQISNMGKSLYMPINAVRKLKPDFAASGIYVYLKDGSVATKKEVKVLEKYYEDNDQFQVNDFDKTYDTILKTFTGSLSALCIAFVIITIFVVFLIVLLVVKMKLIKEQKRMGVYKALGYTTSQLIWQTVVGFAPVIGIGAFVGSILASLTVNNVFVLMLSACGIENAKLNISAVVVGGCFAIITLLAFAMVALCSLKIRKFEPYKMIVEG